MDGKCDFGGDASRACVDPSTSKKNLYYGDSCEFPCSGTSTKGCFTDPNGNKACSNVVGADLGTCVNQQECMPSFWGAKCDKHSANCVDNNVFYSTGDCVKQCNKGWYGFVDNTRRYPSCDKQCTDTYN